MQSFIDTYNNLKTRTAQKIMRDRVIDACEIKPSTFYSWFRRGYVPMGKHQEGIAEIYGVSISDFFPEKNISHEP